MYRQEDIETIQSNLNDIKDNALRVKLETMEPTIKEFNDVYKVILDFIKQKKRIIYGGYAQNKLIKQKKPEDGFYRDLDMADIEFYSYEPLKDIVDLCDLLHSKGFKHVQGSEGVHNETYKIFVNFLNYCDMSYMPKNVYDRCPVIEIEGIKYTHPHFMLVDAYRVYADPLTSYFRLDKTFNRFSTLIKHYPLSVKYNEIELKYYTKMAGDTMVKLKKLIRKKVLYGSQLIIIGHFAYNYLVKKADKNLAFEFFPYYQAISIDYNNDKIKIEKFLRKELGNNLKVKHFTPFFQFYDFHTEYYYNDICLLKLYGHNNRCIVNQFSEKKNAYFGTFQLVFLYLLIDYNYAIIRNDKVEENNYMAMLVKIIRARNLYLDRYNKTILDKTPFQEFTLQCLGSTEDPLRMAHLDAKMKRTKGKLVKFRYEPTGKPGKVPNYKFDNTSGNEKH